MPTVNIFHAFNQRIADFVRKPATRRLRAGTGAYSTPFRGTLFGLSDAEAVSRRLRTRRVDALWLGANPCVPRSLKNILNANSGDGDFPEFQRQMQSGAFAQLAWDADSDPTVSWNPLQKPTHTWNVYRDVFDASLDLDAVAMANFIPWGSQTMKAFLTKLGGRHPALLQAVLRFADALNEDIVKSLRPKLLVVPLSLARTPGVGGVSKATATEVAPHHIKLDSRRFTFHTALCQRAGRAVPVLYVPHPASLRLSQTDRKRVVRGMTDVLKGWPTG